MKDLKAIRKAIASYVDFAEKTGFRRQLDILAAWV
jgi:hypothetical protein